MTYALYTWLNIQTFRAHIRATGTAEMMRYDDKIKQWIQHLDVNEPATVQVVHDQSTQTFVLVISIFQNKCHRIVMKQQIYHNLKYQTNNNNQFHQWRDESRTVRLFGISFLLNSVVFKAHIGT